MQVTQLEWEFTSLVLDAVSCIICLLNLKFGESVVQNG